MESECCLKRQYAIAQFQDKSRIQKPEMLDILRLVKTKQMSPDVVVSQDVTQYNGRNFYLNPLRPVFLVYPPYLYKKLLCLKSLDVVRSFPCNNFKNNTASSPP